MPIANGIFHPPAPKNEPVFAYVSGSEERSSLEATLDRMSNESIEMPLMIGGRAVSTGRLESSVMPHNHGHSLGMAHLAGDAEVSAAIEAANAAWPEWSRMPWAERAAIFLRAADLLAGPWRAVLNTATMLGQSKTAHQAEIDAAAELIDFWRYNVAFMRRIYAEQPVSGDGIWNTVDYRPLEGFVYALSPFNFTSIAGNLPTAPAMLGNTVVWKPAGTAKLAAHFIMEILRQAGLPGGVINLVYGDGAQITKCVLAHETFAGIHFTGSTVVFNEIWRKIAENCDRYRTYPRIVGETGGKNFILAHRSADPEALVTAIIRGAFEYQGQKCSAASRVFIPASLWPALSQRICDEVSTIQVGDIRNFKNFMGAVIDEKAWRRHANAIEEARCGKTAALLAGGRVDKSEGYFVSPTFVLAQDVASRFMKEEFFGPIVTAYVYPDERFKEITKLIDATSQYGLTGSIFATERTAITQAAETMRNAAGNFYINDKPTGAVVGQQPFGGARASGTNDKAGSIWNLIRWVSPRAIKETFVPSTDYRYPYMMD